MSNSKFVKRKFPSAYCAESGGRYYVFGAPGGHDHLGDGETVREAWAEAASNWSNEKRRLERAERVGE